MTIDVAGETVNSQELNAVQENDGSRGAGGRRTMQNALEAPFLAAQVAGRTRNARTFTRPGTRRPLADGG
jgi:hypothetical protein